MSVELSNSVYSYIYVLFTLFYLVYFGDCRAEDLSIYATYLDLEG